MIEDEMVGWHHRLNGQGFEKLQELVMDREAWRAAIHQGRKESDTTELLNKNNLERGFPAGASGTEPTCQHRKQEMRAQSLVQEDLLEEGMAIHSNVLAWRSPWTIQWTEGHGRLESIW